MVRIEHKVWCRRSEGDLGRATGKQPWDLGNPGEAAIAAERFGVADPDCMPWSEATVLYTAKPHGASMTAMPLSPTPDRAGRTLRVDPNHRTVIGAGAVSDKKKWLTLAGPMAFMCLLPGDFTGAPPSGIYSRATTPDGGFHAVLVVGFDDVNACWIIKNSWGDGWGTNGFVRVAYGEAWVEGAEWFGIRNTNPDPWTKRRQRNGVIVETGNGAAHQNHEVFLRVGMGIEHIWQEGGGSWNRAGTVQSPDDSRLVPPAGGACAQRIRSRSTPAGSRCVPVGVHRGGARRRRHRLDANGLGPARVADAAACDRSDRPLVRRDARGEARGELYGRGSRLRVDRDKVERLERR